MFKLSSMQFLVCQKGSAKLEGITEAWKCQGVEDRSGLFFLSCCLLLLLFLLIFQNWVLALKEILELCLGSLCSIWGRKWGRGGGASRSENSRIGLQMVFEPPLLLVHRCEKQEAMLSALAIGFLKKQFLAIGESELTASFHFPGLLLLPGSRSVVTDPRSSSSPVTLLWVIRSPEAG